MLVFLAALTFFAVLVAFLIAEAAALTAFFNAFEMEEPEDFEDVPVFAVVVFLLDELFLVEYVLTDFFFVDFFFELLLFDDGSFFDACFIVSFTSAEIHNPVPENFTFVMLASVNISWQSSIFLLLM